MGRLALKRINRLEEKVHFSSEDQIFLDYYNSLDTPSSEENEKYFLIMVKKYSLVKLIEASMELPDKHDETG